LLVFFFFSSRRRHTRSKRDWSSDVCSSDLGSKTQCADGLSPAPKQTCHRSSWDGRRHLKALTNSVVPSSVVIKNPSDTIRMRDKIGRASCRERVEISVGGVVFKSKERAC